MSKEATERRSWTKFGDAVDEEVGCRLTMVSTEEIFLERSKAKCWNFFLLVTFKKEKTFPLYLLI